MFCLFYDAKTKKVEALNGSGRAALKATLEKVREDLNLKDGDEGEIPLDHVHAVTVPGAAAGWADTIERFGSGKLSLEQILAPAIELGEKGFPVSDLSSKMVGSLHLVTSALVLTSSLVDFGCKVCCESITKFCRIAQEEPRWHISRTSSR
jgi:gamma-glutamyltranspeptidase